jgi:hypothetical protein
MLRMFKAGPFLVLVSSAGTAPSILLQLSLPWIVVFHAIFSLMLLPCCGFDVPVGWSDTHRRCCIPAAAVDVYCQNSHVPSALYGTFAMAFHEV